jgi:hypothetical protein
LEGFQPSKSFIHLMLHCWKDCSLLLLPLATVFSWIFCCNLDVCLIFPQKPSCWSVSDYTVRRADNPRRRRRRRHLCRTAEPFLLFYLLSVCLMLILSLFLQTELDRNWQAFDLQPTKQKL